MAENSKLSLEQLLAYKDDRAAWYWIGMGYWQRNDFEQAAVWLEKTMNDSGNEWAGKSAYNLGLAHLGKYIPNASKDEALRLFESAPGALPMLEAGFLYCQGTETMRDSEKGKELVERAIESFIKSDGNLDYLKPNEFYAIAVMYEGNQMFTIAINYYNKAIKSCDSKYASDQEIARRAQEAISDCQRRAQILGDMSKHNEKHLKISQDLFVVQKNDGAKSDSPSEPLLLLITKLFNEVKLKRSIPAGATAESLIKRGFLFLEVSDWEKAITYFDNVLDINPECAQAYIGMLCAELRITSEAELENQTELFDERPNYKLAIRFADEEYRIKLETYIGTVKNTIRTRIEEEKRIAAEEKRIAEEAKRIADEERRIAYQEKYGQYLTSVQIHGVINFGKYEWRVIDIQDNAVLIIMEGVRETRSYHSACVYTNWSDCDLRKYLNGEFYNSFSPSEQSMILRKTNKNTNNPLYYTDGGQDTDDYVFLLSFDEILQLSYFGEYSVALQKGMIFEKIFSDQHDNKRAALLKGSPFRQMSEWWLRTPGVNSNNSLTISRIGTVNFDGKSVELTSGVRPALWLRLN